MSIPVVPTPIVKLAHAFYERGYSFYLVGGYVRDKLMHKDPKDVDATTDATPDEIKDILEHFKLPQESIYTVGEKYGTIAYSQDKYEYEITTYRREAYEDGSRKPVVTFDGTSLLDDLGRRDFTINAMAVDVATGNLIDAFGGTADMHFQIVRAVGDTEQRILEDPLRMLRAVRFATRFGYDLDEHLERMIKIHAPQILRISYERIRDELDKILLSDRPDSGLNMLAELHLLKFILPEVDVLDEIPQRGGHHVHDVFNHTLDVVQNTPSELVLRLAALLHDTGKAPTHVYDKDKDTFYGHEEKSAEIAHAVLRRLRYPTYIIEAVTALCKNHMRPMYIYSQIERGNPPTGKAIRKLIRNVYKPELCDIEMLMVLNYADIIGHGTDKRKDAWFDLMKRIADERKKSVVSIESIDSPIDGNEIMEACNIINPGPWVGQTKQALTEAVVAGTIEVGDKDAAREFARRYWNL